jgi:hypothetical protein
MPDSNQPAGKPPVADSKLAAVSFEPVAGRKVLVQNIIRQAGQSASPHLSVHREKVLVHSGCKSHPGTGSLRPRRSDNSPSLRYMARSEGRRR